MRRSLDPAGSAEVASTLNALGLALHEIGEFEKAEQLYREALQLDVRLLGPEHVHTILVRGNLALLLHDTGKPGEAESLYRERQGRLREWVTRLELPPLAAWRAEPARQAASGQSGSRLP